MMGGDIQTPQRNGPAICWMVLRRHSVCPCWLVMVIWLSVSLKVVKCLVTAHAHIDGDLQFSTEDHFLSTFLFLFLEMCYIVYRLSTFLAIIFQCVWSQIYEFAIHKLSWTNYILFVYLVLQTSKTSTTEVLPKTPFLFVLTLWSMCRETAKKVQEAWQS